MFGKVLGQLGKSIVTGLSTGLSSGTAASVHRGITRGRNQFSNAGSGMASVHENMFGNSAGAQRGHEYQMQMLANDNAIRLQHMKDATAMEMQSQQLRHDAMMTSVSKGHKGVGEVLDFLLGKDKSEFYRELRKLNQE